MNDSGARYVGNEHYCDACKVPHPGRAWRRDARQYCRNHYIAVFHEEPPAPRTAVDLAEQA